MLRKLYWIVSVALMLGLGGVGTAIYWRLLQQGLGMPAAGRAGWLILQLTFGLALLLGWWLVSATAVAALFGALNEHLYGVAVDAAPQPFEGSAEATLTFTVTPRRAIHIDKVQVRLFERQHETHEVPMPHGGHVCLMGMTDYRTETFKRLLGTVDVPVSAGKPIVASATIPLSEREPLPAGREYVWEVDVSVPDAILSAGPRSFTLKA